MPGHVGTSIAAKTGQEVDPETGEWRQTEMSAADQEHVLARIKANNPEAAKAFEGKSDAEVGAMVGKMRERMGEQVCL